MACDISMRSQVCVMPSMCVLCEGIFDARYDFREEDAADEDASQKQKRGLLCWDCRAKFAGRKKRK